MPLFYNAGTSSPSIDPLPAGIVLDTRDFAFRIDDYDALYDFSLDRNQMLHDIIKCLRKDNSAEIELDYLCMAFVERFKNNSTPEFDELVALIRATGADLHHLLHRQRLYRFGEMPYEMVGTRYNGIELMRRDVFHRYLKKQLDDDMRAATRAEMARLHREQARGRS